jgi:uncharacterized protein YprB with RNaseH-like and TPR domain
MAKNKKSGPVRNEKIKNRWESLDSQTSLSTREKLEKLVSLNLKRNQKKIEEKPADTVPASDTAFLIREFTYPLDSVFNRVVLSAWREISSWFLTVVAGDESFSHIDPMRLLYFDVESTGLSGGTGTIPFMLGFGYFTPEHFRVTIFILSDLSREDEMLDSVDEFLRKLDPSATVTFNGKSFDFPLMETRYILYRKRFPLQKKPHLDFLFPARTIWKNSFESRKLGYLGDMLLGISRDDDIDPGLIPSLYFSYLRSNRFSLLEKVVEHNALDLVGLSALLLLAVLYVTDVSATRDAGEVLGVAMLFEKSGYFDRAGELLEIARQASERQDIMVKAVKHLARLKKKKKLYEEASQLWKMLSEFRDHTAFKELSIHFEHREKDYYGALEFVNLAINEAELTPVQRQDLEKRIKRLQKKIEKLEQEE